MKIGDTVYCTLLFFLCNMGENVGLLTHGNSVNLTNTNHGFPGHNVDLADMMQMLQNQTAELENLKQQIAEIETLKQKTENLKLQSENYKSTIQLLLNETEEVKTLKRQGEIDRSTIKSLQNRVFFLEAELNKLNVSKLPSSQEFSTYLKSMNQLTQNLATNEAIDKNLTQRLNDAVQALDDLKLKDMSTTQLLLNQSEELKQQSANDRYLIHFLHNETQGLVMTSQQLLNQSGELRQQSAKDRYLIHLLQNETQQLLKTTQLLLNQSEELKQHSETDKFLIHLLQNETQRLVKNLDDLKVQVRYTSLSLLDVHSMTEELNGSLIQRLEERISEVHDHIASVSKRIGFTASVSSSRDTWSSGTLVFDVVITNVGNGYNPSTGVFTAPTAGEYVFFVNVQSYGTQEIDVVVVLNGVTKVRTMARSGSSEYNEAGPNLAVLTLQKEDKVWVKYRYGRGYYTDGNITTFSGFLL